MTTLTETTRDRSIDLYPSRKDPEPRILERQDPVLHGPASGVLSEEERESYAENGFLDFETFFSEEELSPYQEEAGHLQHLDELRESGETITEPENN